MIEGLHVHGETRWGLLGPHVIGSERRTRTLGLAVAVRTFNDLAVPGLGGVWFAKPLALATLGVSVASHTGHQNIEVANAIEALACWLALEANNWPRDARLRGHTKLRGQEDLSYTRVRRSSFYVTQPMRQQTVQPLLALGLVESGSERFNAFSLADAGRSLLAAAFGEARPYKKTVSDLLAEWIKGDRREIGTRALCEALSPLQSLPSLSRSLLKDRLIAGSRDDAMRRRAGLAWVETVRLASTKALNWKDRPAAIDESHWRDLRSGGKFFSVRDAALSVLDAVEALIGRDSNESLSLTARYPESIRKAIANLRTISDVFLREQYDPSPGRLAEGFCLECRDFDDAELLAALVRRDGRGLLLRGNVIVPGAAFRGEVQDDDVRDLSPDGDGNEISVQKKIAWPEGISYRVNNLFLLNLDLQGKLDDWMLPASGAAS